MPPHPIYRLKVALDEVTPPIWRRLLVPSTITLPRLHRVLQIAMGWQDCHLHQFIVADACYLLPDPDAAMPLPGERDERRVRLSSLLRSPGDALVYEYDFGDGWAHTIRLEEISKRVEGIDYPVCIGAARAGPPEDSGGPFGYMDLLEVLANRRHPRHREMRQWAGEDFNPEAVDLTAINAELAPRPKRRRQPSDRTASSSGAES